MVTVAELRALADANGVDLQGRTLKDSIVEALLAAGVDPDAAVDDDVSADSGEEAASPPPSADVDDVTEDVVDPGVLPPPPSPPTIRQREEASYDRYRIQPGHVIDYAALAADIPDRGGALPRQVQEMNVPQPETAARTHTFRREVREGNTMVLETVFYDLPDDHTLTPEQLQNLVVALGESEPPFPMWEDFS